MFQTGDYVVDSFNGISKIENIVTLDYVEDKERKYFLLVPINSKSSKVYVPISNAEGKFRKISDKEQIDHLLDKIGDIESVWIENDKEREGIYKEAIKGCNLTQIIGIIKTLYYRHEKRIKEGKKNTAIDEKYFKKAEEILYSEIGFVLHIDNDHVVELIKEKVNEPR